MKKNRIILALIGILAILCPAMFVFVPSVRTSYAYVDDQSPTVSEIISEGNVNADLVKQLFIQLVGSDDYETVLSSATAKKSASEFSSANIIVSFGDMNWTAVYLSTAKDLVSAGDDQVILTLMLSSATSETTQYSTWHPSGSGGEAWEIPTAMYSTSHVRSFLNGTQYSVSSRGTSASSASDISLTDGTSVQNSTFKNFIDSYKDYIITPEAVSWQETQSAYTSSQSNNNLPNDAWGTMPNDHFQNANNNYSNRAHNSDWNKDYIWLPSVAETGTSNSATDGIWALTPQQRSYNNVWLRSGAHSGTYHYGCCLDNTGKIADGSASSITGQKAVAPAFHLNLTKLAENLVVKPTKPSAESLNKQVTYSGEEQSFVLPLEQTDNLEFTASSNATFNQPSLTLKGTDAGEYTVKVKPSEGNFWADDSQDEITFTLTILHKPISVTIEDKSSEVAMPVASLTFAQPSGLLNGDTLEDIGVSVDLLTLSKEGQTYPLDTNLAVGEYEIVATNGEFGNYYVTFISGTYTVSEHVTHMWGTTASHNDGENTHSLHCTFPGCPETHIEECTKANPNVTDPTCTEQGYTEYTCDKCGNSFIDDYVETIPHVGHHHSRVEATENSNGSIEYWQCEMCEKYFADQDCETEIEMADIVIPKLVPEQKEDDGQIFLIKDFSKEDIIKLSIISGVAAVVIICLLILIALKLKRRRKRNLIVRTFEKNMLDENGKVKVRPVEQIEDIENEIFKENVENILSPKEIEKQKIKAEKLAQIQKIKQQKRDIKQLKRHNAIQKKIEKLNNLDRLNKITDKQERKSFLNTVKIKNNQEKQQEKLTKKAQKITKAEQIAVANSKKIAQNEIRAEQIAEQQKQEKIQRLKEAKRRLKRIKRQKAKQELIEAQKRADEYDAKLQKREQLRLQKLEKRAEKIRLAETKKMQKIKAEQLAEQNKEAPKNKPNKANKKVKAQENKQNLLKQNKPKKENKKAEQKQEKPPKQTQEKQVNQQKLEKRKCAKNNESKQN